MPRKVHIRTQLEMDLAKAVSRLLFQQVVSQGTLIVLGRMLCRVQCKVVQCLLLLRLISEHSSDTALALCLKDVAQTWIMACWLLASILKTDIIWLRIPGDLPGEKMVI